MFKLGDIVTWESQSQGYSKAKTGKIVGIVPPNKKPWPGYYVKHYHPNSFTLMWGIASALPRQEESYIVEVSGGKTDIARPKLYWPRVKSLKLVGANRV